MNSEVLMLISSCGAMCTSWWTTCFLVGLRNKQTFSKLKWWIRTRIKFVKKKRKQSSQKI